MTWTYSGDPASSDRDAVRFEIPDTDTDNQLVLDEEINYALTVESGPLGAAAHCCEVLARKFAAKADTVIGSLQFKYSASAEVFGDRAKELRARSQAAGIPFAGGISQADKDARADDDDRVQSSAQRGQFDNPGTGLRDPGRPF